MNCQVKRRENNKKWNKIHLHIHELNWKVFHASHSLNSRVFKSHLSPHIYFAQILLCKNKWKVNVLRRITLELVESCKCEKMKIFMRVLSGSFSSISMCNWRWLNWVWINNISRVQKRLQRVSQFEKFEQTYRIVWPFCGQNIPNRHTFCRLWTPMMI